MKKATVLETICFAFILLFMYTSLSKLFLFHIYLYDLHRSPFIGKFAPVLSILVPLAEIVVAGMLFFNKTRTKGLYGALTLMVLFTIYVAGVLTLTTDRPCTCGGIIRELSWRQHFIFNIFFTLLSVVGIWLDRSFGSYKISL